MKVFRKFLTVCFAFAVAISCSMLTSAETTDETFEVSVDEKIEYLLSRGVPKSLIDDSNPMFINDMYTNFYGQDIIYLGSKTSTLSETKHPTNMSPYSGYIPDSDMEFTVHTYANLVKDSTGTRYRVDRVDVYINYEWTKGKPKLRSKDGISVNWESSLFSFKQDSFHSYDRKLSPLKNYWVISNQLTNPTTLNQGGLGYITNLEYGETDFDGTLLGSLAIKGNANFSLLPKSNSFYLSPETNNTTICAEYVHNTSLINTIGFSYNGFGITIKAPTSSDSTTAAFTLYYSPK